jgi:hypothetical protein
LRCEGAVNQLDVLGFAPEQRRSTSKKARRLWGSCIASSMTRQCFGPGHEVFGRAYRVLLHPAALLYGGFEPRR